MVRISRSFRQDTEVESLIELARIRIDQCQYQSAESTINQALKISQRCGYKLYEIDAELVLAKAYLGLEDKACAIPLLPNPPTQKPKV